ncbi:MAG TPA: glycosyltransferase family 87 protein [Candidatus Dormibacteraeota bacterium]
MTSRSAAERWRWRGTVALTAVALGFVIYPLIEGSNDVINSDWPAFATGGRLIVEDPGHLYDMDTQRRTQLEVTDGRSLVTLGINGILPFLAPAWAAFLAVPFDLLGTNVGGRLWILAGLACLALGLYFAVRPRPPTAILPAFASVPTALLLLNAQLDGFVALGIGAAWALWTRPFLAGLSLGLTLLKPQLVLPLGAALLLTRHWRVLAGWATAGVVLLAASAALNPRWVLQWLPAIGGTVQPGAREIDLAHLGVLLPRADQGLGVLVVSLVALVGVLWLARRSRADLRAAGAVVIAGGVLVAPHALPTDLVLVAAALALWGKAQWQDWLALSVGAAVAAVVPAPWPTAVGVLVVGWLCLRAAGLIEWRREPAPASAG